MANVGTLHLCVANTRIKTHANISQQLNVIEMIHLNASQHYLLALDDEKINLTYRESGARVKRKSKGYIVK